MLSSKIEMGGVTCTHNFCSKMKKKKSFQTRLALFIFPCFMLVKPLRRPSSIDCHCWINNLAAINFNTSSKSSLSQLKIDVRFNNKLFLFYYLLHLYSSLIFFEYFLHKTIHHLSCLLVTSQKYASLQHFLPPQIAVNPPLWSTILIN